MGWAAKTLGFEVETLFLMALLTRILFLNYAKQVYRKMGKQFSMMVNRVNLPQKSNGWHYLYDETESSCSR